MKKLFLFFSFFFIFSGASAQTKKTFVPNYEESKVPAFTLPNPLQTFEEAPIRTIKQWEAVGRPELLEFFTQQVYGAIPGKLGITSWELIEQSRDALAGKARRKQVKLHFEQNGRSLDCHILIYLPKTTQPTPVFLGYNFYGNHTVTTDTMVYIPQAWSRNNTNFGVDDHKLTPKSRGVRVNRWAIEEIIKAGFGLVTVYYGAIDPDRDNFQDGVHPFFYKDGQKQPAENEWGAISAWAWGLSRVMDYLEEDQDVDSGKVIVIGHSRLGKTALWAGATDQRFAGVISNNSGCGGAALSKRKYGETISRINDQFPHWFCKNFHGYSKNEEALPVDQHELIALIAPRPVYVASAVNDQWADPKGEFLSAYHAGPVYGLYGKKGIPTAEMPGLDTPIHNTIAYHIRTGGHDVKEYDWKQYIKWAKAQLEDRRK
jgi:hypothetical protein